MAISVRLSSIYGLRPFWATSVRQSGSISMDMLDIV
jgi:hypothetical protein